MKQKFSPWCPGCAEEYFRIERISWLNRILPQICTRIWALGSVPYQSPQKGQFSWNEEAEGTFVNLKKSHD